MLGPLDACGKPKGDGLMRCARSFRRGALLSLVCSLLAPAASAFVFIEWQTVGDPDNGCETQTQGCFGEVSSEYRISKFEITNEQYAEFLNAVAKADPNGLYATELGSELVGGIARSGSPGSYFYGVTQPPDWPVAFVAFHNTLRFANWLHNGQPTGAQDNSTTEDGAYTITPAGIAANSITRNAGAQVFLTSEDEWYKAAYYDTDSMSYFDYPAGSNAQTQCLNPMAADPNSANCQLAIFGLTYVGAYFIADSPNGTFDQGGNVREWNEAIISGSNRGLRGGYFNSYENTFEASYRAAIAPSTDGSWSVGFRVASIVPEPGTGVLLALGLLGFSLHRGRLRRPFL